MGQSRAWQAWQRSDHEALAKGMHPQITVIIPARGGSQRIPRKNLRPFNGRPIIQWSIQAALELSENTRVVVSTDDSEIADIARAAGADVPFSRPAELADAHAGTAPVIQHAIDALGVPDDHVVVCVYPTSTLSAELLREGVEKTLEHSGQFVVAVGKHRSPLGRALQVSSDGLMRLVEPHNLLVRTQDLPAHYFDAGKFYGATARLWRDASTMMENPFVPFYLPAWAVVDIDEPEDWAIAEALHRTFVLDANQ